MKYVSKLLMVILMMALMVLPLGRAAYASSAGGSRGGIVKLTGDIYVNEGTSVEGDVVTLRGNIYINGSVTGSAVAVFGDIIVNGKVLGDAVSVSGKITVGENGKVLGDTVEAIDGTISQGGAGGYRNYINPPRVNANPWSRTASALASFFSYIGMFLLAALIYLIMPKKINEMSESIESNLGRRAGIGLLTMIGSPLAMIMLTILLVVTIIGIILVPFAWIAYCIALFIGAVPVYLYLGKKITGAVAKQEYASYAALAAGLFTLWLIKVAASFGGLYTGWISFIAGFGVYVIGMGTLLDYIFTHNRRKKQQYQQQYPYPPQGEGFNQGRTDLPATYIPEQREPSNYGSTDSINKPNDSER